MSTRTTAINRFRVATLTTLATLPSGRATATRCGSLVGVLLGALLLPGCGTTVAPTGYLSPSRDLRSSQPARSGGFEAAVARAQRQARVVVVDFGAPWCGPCRVMERTTWSDPGVQRWLDANAVRVHVDIEERSDLKNRFRVGGVPTTIVLRNGRELGRTSGSHGPAQMIEWLRSTSRSG